MRTRLQAIGAIVVAATLVAGCGSSGLGKSGEPIDLTIGYQPYRSESWTGLVLREKPFWKEHLPEGSTVQFKVALQGSITVSEMIAGKQQIGYMGETPAIVGVTKRSARDLRIVAAGGLSADGCGVLLVRANAPKFTSEAEVFKWLNGKTVATPHGGCSDLVTQAFFQAKGVKPKSYLNQGVDVITSSFKKGSIDAASVWEPVTSKLIDSGLARRVTSGNALGLKTAGLVVMSNDLLTQRPDVAEGWLKAELAAERFLADPANAVEIAKMAVNQTNGYSTETMDDAIRRGWPVALGGSADGIKLQMPFTINPSAQQTIDSAVAFLHKIKSIPDATLPDGAVDGKLAAKVLKEDGGSSPVGEIKAVPRGG